MPVFLVENIFQMEIITRMVIIVTMKMEIENQRD